MVQEEGAKVIFTGTHEFPTVQFWCLFQDLIYSILQLLQYKDHLLVQPHAGHILVRHGTWKPEDLGEGPTPLRART